MARKILFACILFFCSSISVFAADNFVNFSEGGLVLNNSKVVSIYLDSNDLKGVNIAAHNLCSDLGKVTGTDGELTTNPEARILIGTVGHSQAIDRVVDAGQLKGKHEKFIIQTVGNQLVIAGSDRRGTIYGIYELSRQIGVSPWYYWADVPVVHHDRIYIKQGIYTDGEPAVRYRGIFLNDEAPCLTSWVTKTFGTRYGGHDFYAKVFELILRLKGNFLWPAMWTYAFYADDPENSKLADEMGVVIGTSHHEPMARNHEEWARARGGYGAWNYNTNHASLDDFFRKGIERMKGTEDIVTIGMRGDGDEAMSAEADTKLLERIVANQRRIIADVTGKPAKETPQVWALYKEVLDYYDKGMRVPDDVTIMLCDDNWGNIRRVPSVKERKHPGGWGLYYHVDYVGAPRNSKWLNVTPTQNMWEQLTLAYDYGINRIWVLNVGDLKPMEYPIDFFMDMAWNPKKYQADHITDHTRVFCSQQFGEDQADEAARILNMQNKYSGRTTVEMMDKNTYDLESGEWAEVVSDYRNLESAALHQYNTLKPEYRDAYRELILFPVQAVSNIYQMYYAQAMNNWLYSKGNPACNGWAVKVEKAFRRDSVLCRQYNKEIAGGKWDGMMTQKHIGYTSWNDDFAKDMMPEVYYINSRSVIEAEHFSSKTDAEKAKWTVIPDMGRTLSGVALMPYTESTRGASLDYSFTMDTDKDNLEIHVITKSTLDFLNKGGLCYELSVDGGKSVVVNFNKDLNEDPKNIYSAYYPTVARRVVEKSVNIPWNKNTKQVHHLTIRPLDPGIVFEKIIIDGTGNKNSQFLFGEESPVNED